MNRLFKTLAVAAVVAVSAQAATAQMGIPWQHDLQAARAQAAEQGKLLLVHFWTPSCGPCKLLDKNVFNQPSVAQVVSTHYVPVKLNANESASIATSMGIQRVPTDVVLTPEGEILTRFISEQTPMGYITQVNKVAQAYQTKKGHEFQRVAAHAPAGQAVNPAYAGLANVAPQAPQPQVPQPSVQPIAQPSTNPYAAAAANPPVAPQPVQANPHAAAAPQPPQADAKPAETRQVQLPAGSPPLGLEGYCPVSLAQKGEWVYGDVQWGAIHRGRTYLFANREARDEFLKPENSDVYSPMLGGNDPVLMLEGKQQVPGLCQFGLSYKGRVYLFRNEENLGKFFNSAEDYSQRVYQAVNGASAPMHR